MVKIGLRRPVIASAVLITVLSLGWLLRPVAWRPSRATLNLRSSILSHRQGYNVELVIARAKTERTDWILQELPGISSAVYVVDDSSSTEPTGAPQTNKGNDAIAYLSYIVDNYDALPDIAIFTHAHREGWNNGFLGERSLEVIKRLNGIRVEREGYVNLRCDWSPGCPHWISDSEPPSKDSKDTSAANEKQAATFRAVWPELHPGIPVPSEVGQACCAQFATSRDRILATPRARWNDYRDWLLGTNLTDSESSRVWEYTWQYVLAGKAVWCPDMSSCYCDGFGVCFKSPIKMTEWLTEKKLHDTLLDKYLNAQAVGEEMVGVKIQVDKLAANLRSTLDKAIVRGDEYLLSVGNKEGNQV
ncbi:hypothetical protein B0H63DRAFT_468534 [Podospora didyma]|uniref:Uncharacterized protein n=1 Tax=Podospora didyma TaxID=330526 RepID=A0AAE0NSJ1_9PEZI|nr:hypothetical protein B0H63DRAFT_468534 [Podospora didyma]